MMNPRVNRRCWRPCRVRTATRLAAAVLLVAFAFAARAGADADGDGMLDEWETRYFGSITTGSPMADPDRDGSSNLAEYQCGTDPMKAGSRLSLQRIQALGSSRMLVIWPGTTGRVYNLLGSSGVTGGFTNVAVNLPATPPQNVYTAAVGTARQTFYRVRLHPMFVGAANTVRSGSGMTKQQSWDDLDKEVGPLGIRRSYTSSLETNFPSTVAGSDAGRRASIFSFKTDWTKMEAGQHSNDVRNLVKSIPAGHLTYLCWFHEPENDGTAAAFVPAFRQFARAVRSVGRSNVKVTLILMTWTWNPASGRNPADWWPGAEYVDAVGLDGYNPYEPGGSGSKWKSFSTIFETAADWLRARGAGEIGVAECGCKERTGDADGKAGWLREAARWADSQRFSFLCYFDSDVGENAGIGWWLRSSTNAAQAFREIAATHR